MKPKHSKLRNIILPIEFNHFTGGMIYSVMDLAEHLADAYNVYVIAYRDSKVLKYSSKITPLILETPWSISINKPLRTIRTYLKVKRLLKRFDKQDTIVFTNNVGSELIFSGFGFFPISLKRVFVSRGGNYKGKTGFFIRNGFKTVSHFIATSGHQSRIIENIGISKNKITIIHNGIDVENLAYQYRFQKNEIINISVVGYISENKNQILAVEVLNELIKKGYNVKLNVFGIAYAESDKKYQEKLLSKIRDLNLVELVKFNGFESNLNKIYENTDILLSCSLSEGFGRVIVEGMAFGIPCVGLKQSGGLNDILTEEENGFLVETNRDDIVRVIEEVITNPALRNKISQNAKETYKTKFTRESMVEKYMAFLKLYSI